MKLAVVAGFGVILASVPAQAAPDCAADADRLRAHLEDAETKTFRWNTTWSVLYGAAAVGQIVLVAIETKPFGTFDTAYRDTLYVGAGKATLALALRLVSPLRVSVPARSEDRCAELVTLRSTLTTLAKQERNAFWLGHIGGLALNLGASAFLWNRHTFTAGAISFAMSFPVGLAGTYTMPRKSWHLWRAEHASWSVAVAVHPERTMFMLAGEI